MKRAYLCGLLFVGAFLFLFSLNRPSRTLSTPTPFPTPTPTQIPTPDPWFQVYQHRYHTPQEVLQGLARDYGFVYELGFWRNYAQVLKGNNSLANILRNRQGVCQQFAELAAAGIEHLNYQFGIMVLKSKIKSNDLSGADHEIMVFREPYGLWGYTSNDQYAAPMYHSLDDLFFQSWSAKYSYYIYRDGAEFPPDWETDQNLLFQAPPVYGPAITGR